MIKLIFVISLSAFFVAATLNAAETTTVVGQNVNSEQCWHRPEEIGFFEGCVRNSCQKAKTEALKQAKAVCHALDGVEGDVQLEVKLNENKDYGVCWAKASMVCASR
jgi:hypothetical protein